MWDTIPWGVVHHGSRTYLNGGLVGGYRTAGNIVIRHNIIRNAYNGVRIRANRCPPSENCNVNVEIYDNDFQFIRDNPVEPEDRAVNCWVYHNRIYNGHGWFSLDGVHGAPIYIFVNVGWFDDKPAQSCVQRDWAADQVIHPGKRYEPTSEGECSRSRTGKVIKLGPEPVEMAQPVYIFNNSWFVRAPILAGGRSRLKFWNNAIEFCDPATIPTSRCIADFETDPTCVQSPAGAVDLFANPFPIGLDPVPFYDCFAPSPDDEFTFTLTNYPGFPDRLQQDGRPFYGWHGDPGFVNGPAGDFKLRPDSLAKARGCVVTHGPGDTLVCVHTANGTAPDIGAFQGSALVEGPDFINQGDERPRLVRADWDKTDGGVRLEMAFSTSIQDPQSNTTSGLRSENGTTLTSAPCRKVGPAMLGCEFRSSSDPLLATETLLIPRSIKSAGGLPATLWAANSPRIEFQPPGSEGDRGPINQAVSVGLR